MFLYNAATGQWFEVVNTASGFVYYSGVWASGWQVQVAEFNADGKSDLLLYNPTSGAWSQAINTGLGSFTYGTGTWEAGLTVVAGMTRLP